MTTVGLPHRKQFVVGPSTALQKHEWPARFQKVKLPNGLAVQHCPALPLEQVHNGRGERVVLIGNVVESKAEKAAPKAVIQAINRDNIWEMTSSWTGHWIIIIDNELFHDICGLFSIYMPREPILQKTGTFVVSNSPSLLIEFYGLPAASSEIGLFQPFAMAPWCFRPELRTLMAGESVSLQNGSRSKSLTPPLEVWDVDAGEVRVRVAEMIVNAVSNLKAETQDQVLCALSGGFDTRLNLAAISASEGPYGSFTFVKPYFYITEADRLLPPKIANTVGAKHEMITAGTFDKERAEAYRVHSGGAVTTFPGSGFDHYAHQYWAVAGEGSVALDGQAYELAVNYHRTKFDRDFSVGDVRRFGFGIKEEDFEEVEAHWSHLRATSYDFDRRDLLFWTGNINGVYARMTQEHDLFVDLFYPACNREQMNLLLSVPVAERDECRFQGTITALIRPELDVIPYNPPEPLHKRVTKRIRNEILKRLPG